MKSCCSRTPYEEALAAIRAKCVECCCGSRKEADACTITECPLHRFLFRRGQDDTVVPIPGQMDFLSIA